MQKLVIPPHFSAVREQPQWQNVESMICDLSQAKSTNLMRYCKLVNHFIALAPQKCLGIDYNHIV